MTATAIVLAAGAGRRLQPLTDTVPKCLLDVAGHPLLGRLLDALAAAGVRRAVVVTGHLTALIQTYLDARGSPLDVVIARNESYATTNNAASLAAARSAVGTDDFVLCDGDLIFSQSPIPALLATGDGCALVVDRHVELTAEEMKVKLGADGRVTHLSKELDPRESAGESIGIQKIGGLAVDLLWDELDRMLFCRAADAYYEEAFQRLIDRGVPFGVCPVAAGTWMEIDDAKDLDAARRRFVAKP